MTTFFIKSFISTRNIKRGQKIYLPVFFSANRLQMYSSKNSWLFFIFQEKETPMYFSNSASQLEFEKLMQGVLIFLRQVTDALLSN